MPLLTWIQKLLRVPDRSDKTRPARRRGRRDELVQLFLTRLEDRRVLNGTAVVTNLDDGADAPDVSSISALQANPGADGTISLREAIAAANNTAGADTITFDPSLFAPAGQQMITLGGMQLTITDSLTIFGPGAGELAISGNSQSRVFAVSSGVTVDLRGLTITGGNVSGTGPDGFGGGILNDGGTLSISSSAISNNVASQAGGGIYNRGTLVLTTSFVSSNSENNLGGGGIHHASGSLTTSDSTFSGNTARSGGAIRNLATLNVANSIFTGNSAGSGGGAIINDGSATIIDSQFSGNSGEGGALFNNGIATMMVSGTTISGNSALRGGGVFNQASLNIANSTVSGNEAIDSGGGLYNDAGASLTITSSTLTANSAATGGAIFNPSSFGGGVVDVGNTIIAGNSSTGADPDTSGAFNSRGHNLVGIVGSAAGFGATGDLLGTSASPIDPRLGPLAGNGGPTFTHALLFGSPAIDAGSNALALDALGNPLSTDPCGVARILDGNGDGAAIVDIGAYELEVVSLFATHPLLEALRGITTDGVTGFYLTAASGIVRLSLDGTTATPFDPLGALAITTDGTFIYWMNPNSGPITDTQILRRAIAGGPREAIYTGVDFGQPIVDGSGIEFVAGSGTPGQLVTADEVQGRIHRLDATNPVTNITQVGPNRYGGFFDREHLNTLDVEAGIVYVADEGRTGFADTPPRVQAIPLSGGSFTTLFEGTLPSFAPHDIEVVGDTIFLANGNQILRMSTSGGTPSVLVTDPASTVLQGLTYFDNALYVTGSRPGPDAVLRVDLPALGLSFETEPLADFSVDGGGNLNVVDRDANGARWRLVRDGSDIVLFDESPMAPVEIGRTAAAGVTGQIVINGANGDDELTIDLTRGSLLPVDGLVFQGDSGSDGLRLEGSGTETAVYTPDSGNPANGTITLDGRVIRFEGLEPLDVTGMATFTLALPGGDDVIDLANGVDFLGGGTTPVVRITGTSGGGAFESVAVWNNALVIIDTTTVDGNDSVTITSASAAGALRNLQIATGSGMDTVSVNGPVRLTGDLSIQSPTITVNADITTDAGASAGSVHFTGNITLGDDVTIDTRSAMGPDGNVTFTSDEVAISTTAGMPAAVDAGAGIVTIRNQAAGRLIDLGSETPPRLSLTDAELDRITATTLLIGSTTAGTITVSSPISQNKNLTLTGGGLIDVAAALSVMGEARLLMPAMVSVAGNVTTSGGLFVDTGDPNSSISGQLSGAGGLTAASTAGTGVVTVSNTANDYTGATNVNSGTLRLGADGVLPDTTAVTVLTAATFDLDALSETIGSLAGAGNVTFTAAATAVLTTGNVGDTTFAGVISGDGNLVKQGAGAFTLSGNNTYTGTTSLNAGTLLVNGEIGTDLAPAGIVTVASGATLGGTGGDINAAVVVQPGGTLAPGASPGTLDTGNLSLASAATFTVEIDAAGNADRVNVTGTVDLNSDDNAGGGATLVLQIDPGFTPTPGQAFTLISNDLADPVEGTFRDALGNELAEGTQIDLGGGMMATLTYLGGPGANDVVLIVNGPFAVLSEGTVIIRRNGDDLEVFNGTDEADALAGGVDDSRPIVSLTDIRIAGRDGAGDTLIVDLDLFTASAGLNFTGTIDFDGGIGAGDSLVIRDSGFGGGGDVDTFHSVVHTFTDAASGLVSIDPDGPAIGIAAFTIDYSGLEPISQTITATHVTLNYAATNDTITVADAAAGQITVTADDGVNPTAETITFAVPTDSLTINAGGGNDTVEIDATDAFDGSTDAFTGFLTVDGQAGADTINVNVDLLLIGPAGALTLTAEQINVNAGAAGVIRTTGTIDINASGTARLGAAGGATPLALRTDGGHVDFDGTANVVLRADLTIDTEQGDNGQAGSVLLANSVVSADAAGYELMIDTSTAFATGLAGDVSLGDFDDSASEFVNHVSITSLGGTAVTDGTLNVTGAIELAADADFTFSGRDVLFAAAGSLALNGVGAVSLTASRRIRMAAGSSLSTEDGEIAILANQTGTTAGAFVAIDVDGSQITSENGDIRLTGTGGTTGSGNTGVRLQNAAMIASTGTMTGVDAARIVITGQGGGDVTAVGPDNHGVLITGGAVVRSTGTTTIHVDGTGGNADDEAAGIRLEGTGSGISSKDGAVRLIGQGGSGAGGAYDGIQIFDAAQVRSTGTATITLTGRGGAHPASRDNLGIAMEGAGLIESASGAILLEGFGGGGAGGDHKGIGLSGGSTIRSTGAATISLEGFGGSLDGMGMPGTSGENIGIALEGGSVIESLGTGFIELSGTAGTDANSDGVLIDGGLTLVRSTTADIGVEALGGRLVMNGDSQVRSDSGDIGLRSTGDVLLGIVNADADLAGAAGIVGVQADFNGDGSGAILDNRSTEDPNITAAAALLLAGSGVGDNAHLPGDPADLNLAVGSVAAQTASGDIHLQNDGGLVIATVSVTIDLDTPLGPFMASGLTITNADGAASGNDRITVRADSPLTVNAPVENNDGSDITLAAEGNAPTDDLTINADITASGGNGHISPFAGHTIQLAPTVTIMAAGTGQILLSAGTDFNSGLPLNGDGTGAILMGDGSIVRSDDGNITLRAPGDVMLSRLVADADTDGIRGDVFVTADFGGPEAPLMSLSDGAGAILDGLTGEAPDNAAFTNIVANRVDLRAATGIGSGGGNLDDLQDVDLDALTLLAFNTVAGHVQFYELDAAALDQVSNPTRRVVLDAGGAFTDADPGDDLVANVTAAELAIRAVNGIGSGTIGDGTDIDTAISLLAARTDSGDLNIDNFAELTVATVGNLSGVVVVDPAGDPAGEDSTNDHISLRAIGTLTLAAGEQIANHDAGNVSLTILLDGTPLSLLVLEDNSTISTNGGRIMLTVDELDLSVTMLNEARIDATLTGCVQILPLTAGRSISLGRAGDVAGDLNISDAEADQITASILEIGSVAAGTIFVDDLTLDPLNVPTLVLFTAGRVEEGTPDAAAADITVQNLGIDSSTGVDLDVSVAVLAIDNASGDIDVTDTDGQLEIGTVLTCDASIAGISNGGGAGSKVTLTVDDIDIATPIVNAGGGVRIRPLTPGRPISLGRDSDVPGHLNISDAEADRITAAILEIGSAAAGTIFVDNLTLDALQVPTLVLLTGADVREGTPDAAADITAQNLGIDSTTGVDLDVSVAVLAIDNAAGDIDVTDTDGNLTIGTVLTCTLPIVGITNGGGPGSKVTLAVDDINIAQPISNAGGGVRIQPLTANRPISLGRLVDAPGHLNISDAEADLITAAILEIGSAAAGTIFVDELTLDPLNVPTLVLFTGGSVQEGSPDAAADITAQNLGVDSTTGVDLDVSVSVLAIDNSSGDIDITDTDGSLTIGTVLTCTLPIVGISNGGGPGGKITLTVDDINIAAPINNSAGGVRIRPLTANRPISLGRAADVAGHLNISDAEADLITAAILEVGSATAGTIFVDDLTLDPLTVPTLVLFTGASAQAGATDADADVSVRNLGIDSATGVNLDVDVRVFAALNRTSGNIEVTDTDEDVLSTGFFGLTVGTVLTCTGSIDGVANQALAGAVDLAATFVAASVLMPDPAGDVLIDRPIVTNGGNVSITADRDVLSQTAGTITTTAVPAGNHSGDVTIMAGATVDLGGLIETRGRDGAPLPPAPMAPAVTVGGDGGDVRIEAGDGDLMVTIIDTSGGRGGNNGEALGDAGAGGHAGDVTIVANNGGITLGAAALLGGTGGDRLGLGAGLAGNGGDGGRVYIRTRDGAIVADDINATGGSGGTASGLLAAAGMGGRGGEVFVVAEAGPVTLTTINASGGAGGDGDLGATAGAAGDAADVVVRATDDIVLNGQIRSLSGRPGASGGLLGADGTVTLATSARLIDNDDMSTDILAGRAQLIAVAGIAGDLGTMMDPLPDNARIEIDVLDLAATTVTGNIVIRDNDAASGAPDFRPDLAGLVIGQILGGAVPANGMLFAAIAAQLTDGVTVTDPAGGRIDVESVATLRVNRPVDNAGTDRFEATIRLAGTAPDATADGIILSDEAPAVLATVTAAAGDIVLDAHTGRLTMGVLSRVETPADVFLSADDVAFTGGLPASASVLRATGADSQVVLAPDSAGVNIELGNGAAVGFAVTDAELNTIEAPFVRIGVGAVVRDGLLEQVERMTAAGTFVSVVDPAAADPLRPYAAPTTGTITFVGDFTADAAFGTRLFQLRTRDDANVAATDSVVFNPGAAVDLAANSPGRHFEVFAGSDIIEDTGSSVTTASAAGVDDRAVGDLGVLDGDVFYSAERSIGLNVDAGITTLNGEILLLANDRSQTTDNSVPTGGTLIGITLTDADVTTGVAGPGGEVGGDLVLQGTGGDTADGHVGVLIRDDSRVRSLGNDDPGLEAGVIAIIGAAGGVNDNAGVVITAGSLVQSTDSNVTIRGQSDAAGTDGSNVAVVVSDSAVVETTTGGGSVTLIGTDSSGTGDDNVLIDGPNTRVQTMTGAIRIVGTNTSVRMENASSATGPPDNAGQIRTNAGLVTITAANDIFLGVVNLNADNAAPTGKAVFIADLGFADEDDQDLVTALTRLDALAAAFAANEPLRPALDNLAAAGTRDGTGRILDNRAGDSSSSPALHRPNVLGGPVQFDAGNGIGVGFLSATPDPIDMQVPNVEARTATGGIYLTNLGTLTIGNAVAPFQRPQIGGTAALLVTSTTQPADMNVTTLANLPDDGDLIVADNIFNLSGGDISLDAGTGDLDVHGAVTADRGGNIDFDALSGSITVTADVTADRAGALAGGSIDWQALNGIQAAAVVLARGGGNIDFEAALGSIFVTAPVIADRDGAAAGGQIDMAAGQGKTDIGASVRALGGGNITLNAKSATPMAGRIDFRNAGTEIQVTGPGTIRGDATGQVTFFDGSTAISETGVVRQVAPRVVGIMTPQITQLGQATLTVDIGVSSEQNFTVTIFWGDEFTVSQGVTSATPVANPDVFGNPDPSSRIDTGTHVFTHTYTRGTPNSNPADPIQGFLLVTNDPLINFFGSNTSFEFLPGAIAGFGTIPNPTNLGGLPVNESLSLATRRFEFPVPGEGIGGVFFVLDTGGAPLFFREFENPSPIFETTPFTAFVQTLDFAVGAADQNVIDQRVVVLEVLQADGSKLTEVVFRGEEADDVLNNLPKYLKKLPDGRYRILLKEPGEERLRLIRDLLLRDGVPTEFKAADDAATVGQAPRTFSSPAERVAATGEIIGRAWESWGGPRRIIIEPWTDDLDTEDAADNASGDAPAGSRPVERLEPAGAATRPIPPVRLRDELRPEENSAAAAELPVPVAAGAMLAGASLFRPLAQNDPRHADRTMARLAKRSLGALRRLRRHERN